jgi:radical SAM family uncharacterized protein/radical SAM-linked protein
MSMIEHPYASFVHLVQKPARYLGGEFGAKPKDWSTVQARVCLAFPDLYDIGMSHLGFKILYKLLNDDPRTLAERAYAPWVDMQEELRKRALPLLSLETARPLRDFDVVGFSLQFELTYTNVLTMLDLGGVPLRSRDRSEGDPLVIAGGPTATHPEPLSAFIDAFVIGDGEESATNVALLWTKLKSEGVARDERLRALAKLPGIYVPSLYATAIDPDTGLEFVERALVDSAPLPVHRALVDDLNRFPFPDDGPVGGPEAIFDRMSIEIARGCTEGCRFCQAGMIYRPVRERDPEQIVETVVSAIKKSGYDEASLTSLSTADYSCIAPLIKKVVARLAPEKVSLGVSSLRAYGLDEDVLDDLQRVRATGVTFAPEAGSQRMRDVVNKNVTEEQLMTTAERIFSRGWSSMKLYFMIGLPTEEESDVREIVRVGARARDIGKRVKKERNLGGAPKVTVSVSTHVPKPHTPFQWCAMDAEADVLVKQGWLKEEARVTGVDLRMHDCSTSWLEGVFARGDRKLCDVLERAFRGGARFDSWEDQLKIDVWVAAFEAEGVDPKKYLGTLPVTARLPWDHISVGLEEGFLAREYRKAVASRLSPPCGKAAGAFVQATNLDDALADTRKLVCYDCGVACDLSAMREERIVYLTKLGAKSRVTPKALPVVVQSEKKKGPPPRIVQGESRRYRFAYTKLGPSAFLSHLDLIRALPRAFRRIDMPLYYSSGYHPKAEMTFGPALSLGVSSHEELVDVKLTVDCDPQAIAGALSEGAPDGIRFTRGVRLGPNDAGVSRIIDSARYAVAFARSVLAGKSDDGQAWLEARVAALLASSEHKVIRRIDGIGKVVDVRAFVRSITVDTEASRAAIAGAGIVGDLVTMLVDVEIRGSGAVKISEVVEALATEELPHRAVRVALGAWKDGAIVSPIELDLVRRPKEAREAEPDAGASDDVVPLSAETETPATFDEAVT